jgi:hypothetical protein
MEGTQLGGSYFKDSDSIIWDEASAEVSFGLSMRPIANVLADISRANPLTSADKSPDDDHKNASTLSRMRAYRKEFHVALRYNVQVTDGIYNGPQIMMRKINLLNMALNFCVALTQIAGASKFLRNSTNSLRVIYFIAVAFRGLLVQ